MSDQKIEKKFELVSPYKPTLDQAKAIKTLVDGIEKKQEKYQVLLGATGTGKTFTMANVIAKVNKPTVVIAHNKTLVMQLYTELKDFFPNNHVEYFVSYFDFFQPEAYIPRTDTYIEKSSLANKDIEMMRLATLSSISQYKDVIVVASVASIYPTSPPNEFVKYWIVLSVGMITSLSDIKRNLVKLNYHNNAIDLKIGCFRTKGDVLEVVLGENEDYIYRVSFYGDEVEEISKLDALTGEVIERLKRLIITPADEYVVNNDVKERALKSIKDELQDRLQYYRKFNKPLEAERIEQRTKQDVESIQEFGVCAGIENYARHFEDRLPGEEPYTIFDYLGDDWLLLIDESHMTLPQFRGMHHTDLSRKNTLVEYGFRLPSALDNRPLSFDEINAKIKYAIYFSATPQEYELNLVNNHVVEQIIRPTGLLDPVIEVRPTKNQVEDLIVELQKQKQQNERTFVTVMTIKMAESLTEYLKNRKIKVAYLHNELKTLQRTKIINDLRKGIYDVVVGINLLREGLDVPEVSLVAIFDADKPGLFRNERSLIQTIGRAARNVHGRVIMYADNYSKDMENAINETRRRRAIQEEYNLKHHVKPTSIVKPIRELNIEEDNELKKLEDGKKISKNDKSKLLNKLRKEMLQAAKNQEYERAASLRDMIIQIEGQTTLNTLKDIESVEQNKD